MDDEEPKKMGWKGYLKKQVTQWDLRHLLLMMAATGAGVGLFHERAARQRTQKSIDQYEAGNAVLSRSNNLALDIGEISKLSKARITEIVINDNQFVLKDENGVELYFKNKGGLILKNAQNIKVTLRGDPWTTDLTFDFGCDNITLRNDTKSPWTEGKLVVGVTAHPSVHFAIEGASITREDKEAILKRLRDRVDMIVKRARDSSLDQIQEWAKDPSDNESLVLRSYNGDRSYLEVNLSSAAFRFEDSPYGFSYSSVYLAQVTDGNVDLKEIMLAELKRYVNSPEFIDNFNALKAAREAEKAEAKRRSERKYNQYDLANRPTGELLGADLDMELTNMLREQTPYSSSLLPSQLADMIRAQKAYDSSVFAPLKDKVTNRDPEGTVDALIKILKDPEASPAFVNMLILRMDEIVDAMLSGAVIDLEETDPTKLRNAEQKLGGIIKAIDAAGLFHDDAVTELRVLLEDAFKKKLEDENTPKELKDAIKKLQKLMNPEPEQPKNKRVDPDAVTANTDGKWTFVANNRGEYIRQK